MEKDHITLTELQLRIKAGVEGAVALPVWVAAELAEVRVNRASGHCYMELVEKGGQNGVPRARVNAVAWRSAWGVIRSYFISETGREPAAGMNVLLKVVTSYHELYGLSLVVSDIDPLYTLGDMERQRQQVIARLQEEGVWEMNRTLPRPFAPQRIAVISSAGAAGYQDFMRELSESGFRFEVSLFEAVMQGHGASDSIIDALERITDFDVVVIIRGGGAQSDLAAFDSYRLAAHIAQFPVPVVTGIGHDRDQSIVDMVAWLPLKTPTAAAGWLVQNLAELLARIESLQLTLGERVAAGLEREKARLDNYSELLRARRPERILALGFALVRSRGALVADPSLLRSGDKIEIEFENGKIEALIP